MNFAVQVDLTAEAGGGTIHRFGSGPAALDEAREFEARWRDQPPGAYWLNEAPDGTEERIYVRDITDVRVVVGGVR